MSQYWLSRNNEQHGPYEEEAMVAMLGSGEVLPTEKIHKVDGEEGWVDASTLVAAEVPVEQVKASAPAAPVLQASKPVAPVLTQAAGVGASQQVYKPASDNSWIKGLVVGVLVVGFIGFKIYRRVSVSQTNAEYEAKGFKEKLNLTLQYGEIQILECSPDCNKLKFNGTGTYSYKVYAVEPPLTESVDTTVWTKATGSTTIRLNGNRFVAFAGEGQAPVSGFISFN